MGIFDHLKKEIDARDKQEGITPADVLDLSPTLRRLMNRIMRQGEITVEEAAEHIGESPTDAREMLDALVDKGYLKQEEKEKKGTIYRTRFARRRRREIPKGIWTALGKKTED